MIDTPFYEAYLDVYSPAVFMEFYASLEEEFFLRANPSRPIPFSQVPIILDPSFEPLFAQLISLLWTTLSNPVYRELSAENIPEPLLPPSEGKSSPIHFDPDQSIGCIDLHLDGRAPRMIEFMVLPPGCVGVYPGMLDRYGAYLRRLLPDRRASCFREGWDRERCEEEMLEQIVGQAEPERVAIIDWEPQSQVTYGEFCYTLDMLWKRRGIPGVIADPREITAKQGRVLVKDDPVDRILNRLTLLDWGAHHQEIEPYTRLLWESPEVFAYHPYLWYLGDKTSLTLLSDPSTLRSMGLSDAHAQLLTDLVPQTRPLSSFCPEGDAAVDLNLLLDSFGSPSNIVFKPLSSHGSKGIIFGPIDTPTRRSLEEALRAIDPNEYAAMEYVPTPEIVVPRGGGQRETWHFDLRIFVLNGRYVFPGGRVYFGDYTNQVPCRGFAPLFFA
jgi:hypothetical protein